MGSVVVLALAPAGVPRLGAQSAAPNHDPDSARLITSDIPNFWRAFDTATFTTAGDVFQRDYIDGGTAGLHDFLRNITHWLYQGDRSSSRPADLGYYVGYEICESLYRRTADKADAVRRMLHITDPDEFLRQSGYAERFR